MRNPHCILWILGLLSACSEYTIQEQQCLETLEDFSTEEVSSLESMQGPMDTQADAVVITRDREQEREGSTWRIQSIEVLLLIEVTDWDSYPADVPLTVQVFDGSDPRTAPNRSVTQLLDKDTLSWEQISLSRAGRDEESEWFMSWWAFDFSHVTPDEGLSSEDYIVSVDWQDARLPMVGYSGFNRSCDRNWTRPLYPEEWQWNGEWNSSDGCSWPMFRVTSALSYLAEEC